MYCSFSAPWILFIFRLGTHTCSVIPKQACTPSTHHTAQNTVQSTHIARCLFSLPVHAHPHTINTHHTAQFLSTHYTNTVQSTQVIIVVLHTYFSHITHILFNPHYPHHTQFFVHTNTVQSSPHTPSTHFT